MFRMDEEQFQALLERNPSLSIYNHNANGGNTKHRAEETEEEEDRKNKYHNYPVYVFMDGFVFDSSVEHLGRKEITRQKDAFVNTHGDVVELYDSKKEYLRCLELRNMEKAGTISDLKRQYRLLIQPAAQYRDEHLRAITYCADFVYQKDGQTIVEDVKGYSKKTKTWLTTQVFDLKWKLLKAKYPNYIFQIF